MTFWREKTLAEMTPIEWESLCDGCARCCLIKLEAEDTGQVHYTSVVCEYLNDEKCQCRDYPNRNTLVPTCVHLTADSIPEWLPTTCAYRLIDEGKDLKWWHPLVSGDEDTVHQAGISVRGKVVSEKYVHPEDVEERIIRWVEI